MWPIHRKPRDDFANELRGAELVVETRWSRRYCRPDETIAFIDSRFRDGSASISYRQLVREWETWTDDEQIDFCSSFAHFRGRGCARMLRFLMEHGNERVWSTIAIPVALKLPSREAVSFLCACVDRSEIGQRANYFQACWITRSKNAIPTLKHALQDIWASPDLMKPDAFCNWVAHDAIYCIDALIRLGEPAEEFAPMFQQLAQHPSMHTQTQKWLSEHFDSDAGISDDS